MSGGLAFVYDPDRKFAPLCNVDVAQDLFPVEDGEVGACTAFCTALVCCRTAAWVRCLCSVGGSIGSRAGLSLSICPCLPACPPPAATRRPPACCRT